MKVVRNTVLCMCIVLLAISINSPAYAVSPKSQVKSIDTYVQGLWSSSNIPGLAVAVIKDNKIIYNVHDGYADSTTRRPVTNSTLFELGSNSKAFTALAILQLENQGVISAQASISRYLPWFWMPYKGQKAVITVDDLMHHTSGIATETLNTIPSSTANNALQETVTMLVGTELKHQPGQLFEYASINYDILGLIIEKVTGQTYEQYIHDHLLLPLGLTHTYVGRDSLATIAQPIGYKLCFIHPCRYDAPNYQGNTPAGYIISDQEDMIRWSEIQLGVVPIPPTLAQLVQQSHLADRSVPPGVNGSSYGAGWEIFQIGDGEISHSGSNPTFSSYIGFLPAQKVGVVVLANMDNNNTNAIGQGIINLFMGREQPETTEDQYEQIDRMASLIICLCALIAIILLWFIADDIRQLFQRKRTLIAFNRQKMIEIAISHSLLGLFVWFLYDLPALVFQGVPWGFVRVWGPETIIPAVVMMALNGGLTYLYYLLTILTRGVKERAYSWIIVFSIISGMGNAFIIFVINETFVRTDNLTNGLLFYFCIGIVAYVFGQRFVRRKAIELTSDVLFTQRVELLRALQDTPYRDFERLERGKVLAGLNDDTEVISNAVGLVITGLTNLVTLLFCLIYLGFLNILGLLIAVVVITCAAGFYILLGQRAEKLWEQMRDSQNRFFQLINDLFDGFKELQLNRSRRLSFQQDIEENCAQYKEKRVQGEKRFTDVFVMGNLLFIIVIGFVAFLYPYIFPGIGENVLHNYVFIFLYMTGPVNGVLGGYPQFIRMRISWKRIGELSQMLAKIRHQRVEISDNVCPSDDLRVEVQDVFFQYVEKDGKTFMLGPINYTFRAGEITFITGGNGSGKSTLAKLIAGLYVPDGGCIRVNGTVILPEQLREHYSAIFSDFYLFEKLYGLVLEGKEVLIQDYLASLRIADKVRIEQGKFSTIQLSSGQRKRLALLVSYLEDRPICLYDEWASDQDPEYRAFFYDDILPALRAKGKCVIIITHDDRYFRLADTILKLETGKMVPALIEGR